MAIVEYGLLVDYELCNGCGICQEACRQTHAFEHHDCGISLLEIGPLLVDDGSWEHEYLPVFNNQCDLCMGFGERNADPLCVAHCTARCLLFGPISELTDELMQKPKMVIETTRSAFMVDAKKVAREQDA